MGDSICYFAGTEAIEKSDILTKDSLQIFPIIRKSDNHGYSLIRRLMRSPLTIQHTVAI